MKLVYIPANMAWVFLFGDDIRTATIQDMGGFGRFFKTREEAVEAAKQCGLSVSPKGNVTSNDPALHSTDCARR